MDKNEKLSENISEQRIRRRTEEDAAENGEMSVRKKDTVRKEEIPAGQDDSVKKAEMPAKEEGMPAKEEEMPVKGAEVSEKEKELTGKEAEIPVKKEKMPAKRNQRRKTGRMKKTIPLLLFILAAGGGFFFWTRYQGKARAAGAGAQQVRTATVGRGTLVSELSSAGTISPKDTYTITFLVEGEVILADFEEGDQVEEGRDHSKAV